MAKHKERSWKWVKPLEFKRLKAMLNAGVNKSMVAEVSKRNWRTIDLINKSKDFVGYKEITSVANAHKISLKPATRTGGRIFLADVLDEIKKTNTLLEKILATAS